MITCCVLVSWRHRTSLKFRVAHNFWYVERVAVVYFVFLSDWDANSFAKGLTTLMSALTFQIEAMHNSSPFWTTLAESSSDFIVLAYICKVETTTFSIKVLLFFDIYVFLSLLHISQHLFFILLTLNYSD